jgi:hypothetical protein
MRTLGALTVVAVLAYPAGAGAGDHQADVFLAGSYLNAEGSDIKLAGWHGSFAVNVPEKKWLGLILDVSGHFLGGDDADPQPVCAVRPCPQPDRSQITFMVGPRVTPFNDGALHMLFAHVLAFGAVHRTGGPDVAAATSGAVALGVGYDFPVTGEDVFIPRIQADYVLPVSSDVGKGWRISAGVVYRLKSELH